MTIEEKFARHHEAVLCLGRAVGEGNEVFEGKSLRAVYAAVERTAREAMLAAFEMGVACTDSGIESDEYDEALVRIEGLGE